MPPPSLLSHAKRRRTVAVATASAALFSLFLLLLLVAPQRTLNAPFSVSSELSASPPLPPLKFAILEEAPMAQPLPSPLESAARWAPLNAPPPPPPPPLFVPPKSSAARPKVESVRRREGKCDLYHGRWERDDEQRYPLYQPGACPFVDEAFNCQKNGRADRDYLKWRWKPYGCDLPRLRLLLGLMEQTFLERIRGKRLMFVGDSMNRNQFESMLCLLWEALPDKSKMYETRGYKISKGRGYFIFKFVDYDCTVEFVRSHFLVKEGVRTNRLGSSNPTLSIDRIDKSANRWRRADILVFNTGHWWTHGKTARGGILYPQFDAIEAYRRSINTWGKWIDDTMGSTKNVIFYRGYSAAHFRGGDWDSGGTCNGETDPIKSGAFLDSYPVKMKIVEEVISRMHVPVVLLNVTKLTNYRKDGHPSVYGKMITEGEKLSKRRQDCSHWCLPGIPDSWNELIYATLVLEQVNKIHNR